MAASYAKNVKIERLRLNDNVDQDTSNYQEAYLYGCFAALENRVGDGEKRQKELETNPYLSWQPSRLKSHLQKRNLSCDGDKRALSARLYKHEKKNLEKDLKMRRTELEKIKAELQERVSHPVSAVISNMREEREQISQDTKVQQKAVEAMHRRNPTCDYDWKDSHWEDRSWQQLRDICSRRGMPGCGTKATMLKWLDTGHVNYEDLSMTSLKRMCHERGIKTKSKDKRIDIAKRLLDADEAEEDN